MQPAPPRERGAELVTKSSGRDFYNNSRRPLQAFADVAPTWRSIGSVVADQRRRRQAERLHALGPRPMFEAMVEIADGSDLDAVLRRYARLDADTVKELGGDLFPPVPVHGVA